MEANFAAHSRNAKAVSVAANAFDHAVNQLAGFLVVFFTKAERVHRRDRAGTHGKYVAQDAANACGRALIGFDVRGVVVAFHFENHGLTVADINNACVFAGATDNLRASRRQLAKVDLGRFVRTVFVPHRRENTKFGEGGFASDNFEDAVVFVGFDPVCINQFGRDGRFLHVVIPFGRCALFKTLWARGEGG